MNEPSARQDRHRSGGRIANSLRNAGAKAKKMFFGASPTERRDLRQTEEREQVRRIQERVEGDDPTVGDFDDLQRPRLVATARAAWPVLPESRRTVRPCGHEARAAAFHTSAEHPASDLGGAAHPELVRRHRQCGFLVEQRGQRLHVVPLERIDIAVEQLAVRLVHRIECVGRSVNGREVDRPVAAR